MRKMTAIIHSAQQKNGKDFKNWIKATPTHIASIEEVRKITQKIDYSLSKASESDKKE